MCDTRTLLVVKKLNNNNIAIDDVQLESNGNNTLGYAFIKCFCVHENFIAYTVEPHLSGHQTDCPNNWISG